jgi:hypothetical protein
MLSELINKNISETILMSLRADLMGYNHSISYNKFRDMEIGILETRATLFYLTFEIFTVDLYWVNESERYVAKTQLAFNGTNDYSKETFEKLFRTAVPVLGEIVKKKDLIQLANINYETIKSYAGCYAYEFTYECQGQDFDPLETPKMLKDMLIIFHKTMTMFSEELCSEFARYARSLR